MCIPQPKQYILDFEQLGLGLFVHWGLYSQLGKGEWYFDVNKDQMPMEEYQKLMNTFTAEDFDAEKFVLTAKNAGFKYITLTTRHHEGFSLFDTCGLNEFDAPHSPAGRDIVKEFVDACHRHEIMPMLYHTTLDWWKEEFNTDFDKYLDYFHKSVEILCTNYGKIGGLWFDGNWSKPDADWKEDRLYGIIRKHQPEAMIINNTGLHKRGETGNVELDSVTFENGQAEPMDRRGMLKYVAAEMCHTINDHWGIGYADFNYKSPAQIIKSLCNCRKVGANYLMNIGPEAQGKIAPIQQEIMSVIGRWMGIFGEAIYNGRPYVCKSAGENFILKSVDEKYLYIFAFDLGRKGSEDVVAQNGQYTGAYAFDLVEDEIESIEWMDNGEQLKFIQGNGMLTVKFTGTDYGVSYVVRVAKAKIKG